MNSRTDLVVVAVLISLEGTFRGGEARRDCYCLVLGGTSRGARPMAVFSLVLAAASSLNLKGKEVQGEVNPHQIRRLRAAERDD